MSPSITRHAARSRRTKLWVAAGVASATAAAVTLGGGAAFAATPSASPAVTRAALDPSLVAGRGANVSFLEQEAENATTNGSVISGRSAYTLAAEASGRSAVTLAPGRIRGVHAPGHDERDHRALQHSGRADRRRHHVAAERHGQRSQQQTMTLTSEYAWLYNTYPFSNDPTLTTSIEPDWYTTECACVPGTTTTFPAPFRPNHFYDEQRMLLGKTYHAGDKIRLTVPSGAAVTTVDLLDSENVGLPKVDLIAANVLLFGADPIGKKDSADAFDKAIAFAKKAHLKVYVPPGTYQVNRHIVVDNVTIEGAGNWYTIIKGHEVALSTPAPDGSVHTGVGFYGKYAADGGSTNVHLSGFAIEGDVSSRVDTDQVNGIGGALSNSSIDGLYIHHTKVGIWLDGPMDNLEITNNIIVDQIADGINFHTGVTNSSASNNFLRNTGDDAMAMWSEHTADANDTFDHNTVQTPVLANGIALYGGTDNTISNNLVADPIREGSGLHIGSRFGAEAFDRSRVGHQQHHRARRHVRAELEHRPGRDLDLRAGEVHHRGHRGGRGQLPGQHLQRHHGGQ